MAQETDSQLATRSLVIRNEAGTGGNTKERHDDMNQALIDSKINNDKIDTDNALATGGKTVPGRDAVKAYIAAALAALVDSSPATLDTLNELAAALADDPNFATTMATALGLKAATADVVGVQDLYYPAFAGYPRATLGAFFANLEMSTSFVNLPVLAFQDHATDKSFAQFQIVPPRKWNGGTITILPVWTAQSGGGTVRWELNGGMYRNDDALTVALGTAQTSDDTLLAVNDFHTSPETAPITLAGTFVSGGNLVVIQIARDPTNDTLAANACLIGIIVRWTMNAAKDA